MDKISRRVRRKWGIFGTLYYNIITRGAAP
jgi:hypothetical protein